MRRAVQRYGRIVTAPILCGDCIIATPGYDFREGRVCFAPKTDIQVIAAGDQRSRHEAKAAYIGAEGDLLIMTGSDLALSIALGVALAAANSSRRCGGRRRWLYPRRYRHAQGEINRLHGRLRQPCHRHRGVRWFGAVVASGSSGATRGIRGGHLAIVVRASSDPAAPGKASGEQLEANSTHDQSQHYSARLSPSDEISSDRTSIKSLDNFPRHLAPAVAAPCKALGEGIDLIIMASWKSQ